MAKVTVRDVTESLRNLKRFENYASRNMDNLPIAQANENVKAARDLLKDTVRDFQDTDVSTLMPDTTDTMERIEYCQAQIDYQQESMADCEEEIVVIVQNHKEDPDYNDGDTSWEERRIDSYKDQIANYQEEIRDLEESL